MSARGLRSAAAAAAISPCSERARALQRRARRTSGCRRDWRRAAAGAARRAYGAGPAARMPHGGVFALPRKPPGAPRLCAHHRRTSCQASAAAAGRARFRCERARGGPVCSASRAAPPRTRLPTHPLQRPRKRPRLSLSHPPSRPRARARAHACAVPPDPHPPLPPALRGPPAARSCSARLRVPPRAPRLASTPPLP